MFITVTQAVSDPRLFRNSPIAGNGVQKAFYDDPNVLYISIHVYQDGKFYPGGDEGNWDYCGGGNAIGK
jgi:acetoin utilization deacetylase AcuC-like enzyme